MTDDNKNMKGIEIFNLLMSELERAKEKYPKYPRSMTHAVALIMEEAGELQQAVNNHTWNYRDPQSWSKIENEAIQTGAMVIRFLWNIHKLNNTRCVQGPDPITYFGKE